jgi:hypothetical protein
MKYPDVNSKFLFNRILLSIAALCCCAAEAFGQSLGGRPADTIKWHKELERRFKTGDTNVPLITVTAFGGCHDSEMLDSGCLSGFDVRTTGTLSKGFTCISNTYGPVGTLDPSKLKILLAGIQKLPLPPKAPTSCRRPIVLAAIRGTNWFQAVYDCADLPKEVRELFEMVGEKVPDIRSK